MRAALVIGAFVAGCGGSAGGASSSGDAEADAAMRRDDAALTPRDASNTTSHDAANGCDGSSCGGCVAGEERPCFEGDPALAGVGACVRGMQRCEAAGEFGARWGVCVGAGVASEEIAGNDVDEDCDGDIAGQCGLEALDREAWRAMFRVEATFLSDAPFVQGPAASWFGMATDAEGNLVVAGMARGWIELAAADGSHLFEAPSGTLRRFLFKLDRHGQLLWHREDPIAIGQEYWHHRAADMVAIDGAGRIYVAEEYGVQDHGDGGGYHEARFAAFGPDGSPAWERVARGVGTGDYVGQSVLAVDASGNIVIAGVAQGAAIEVNGTRAALERNDGGYVAGLSPEGEVRFVRGLRGSGSTGTHSIESDGMGGAYVAMSMQEGAVFDGVSDDLGVVVLSAIDASGETRWRHVFDVGDYRLSPSTSVEVDAYGDVVLMGPLEFPADLGGGTITSTMRRFIASFGADGTHRWSRGLDTDISTIDPGSGNLAVDSAGNLYTAVDYLGTTMHVLGFGAGGVDRLHSDVGVIGFDAPGWTWVEPICGGLYAAREGTTDSEATVSMLTD